MRPVAAADYWVDGKSSLMKWFSMEIIGVIPVGYLGIVINVLLG